MSGVLRFLGVLYLIVVIGLSITLFCNYGFVEIDGYYSSYRELNPTIAGVAIGMVFQGLLVCYLACGLAEVIDTNKEILVKLRDKANNEISIVANKKKYKRCSACGELNDEDANFCKKCDHYLEDTELVIK